MPTHCSCLVCVNTPPPDPFFSYVASPPAARRATRCCVHVYSQTPCASLLRETAAPGRLFCSWMQEKPRRRCERYSQSRATRTQGWLPPWPLFRGIKHRLKSTRMLSSSLRYGPTVAYPQCVQTCYCLLLVYRMELNARRAHVWWRGSHLSSTHTWILCYSRHC